MVTAADRIILEDGLSDDFTVEVVNGKRKVKVSSSLISKGITDKLSDDFVVVEEDGVQKIRLAEKTSSSEDSSETDDNRVNHIDVLDFPNNRRVFRMSYTKNGIAGQHETISTMEGKADGYGTLLWGEGHAHPDYRRKIIRIRENYYIVNNARIGAEKYPLPVLVAISSGAEPKIVTALKSVNYTVEDRDSIGE